MNIYLDNASTTALSQEALAVLNEANQKFFANPSSLHSLGMKAKKELEKARKLIAKSISAQPEEIFFTSGATESNNSIFSCLDYDLIISSPSEHPCVIEPAKNSRKPIVWLNLDQEGFINLEELETEIQKAQKQNPQIKILVSIMHGNNEIGTVQDIEAIGKLTKQYSCIFHSDCVQTYTKLEIDVNKLNLDLASFSAHKIHGPKGLGFLYKKASINLNEFMLGGGQEKGLRSGTENLASIITLAHIIEKTNTKDNYKQIKKLEDEFINKLKGDPGLVFNGPKDRNKSIPGIINISKIQSKLNSEQLVLQYDLKGICISSGSACSSNKNDSAGIISSYVLRACRLEETIASKAIRVSISKYNNSEELKKAASIILE